MKLGIRILLIVIATATLAAGCTAPAGGRWPREGVVRPQSARPPASVTTARNLKLTIETDREWYEVAQPVYATVRLQNIGEQTQRVFGSLDPTSGAATFQVTGTDGKRRVFVPLVEADHDESILTTLEPGAVIADVAPVFFGASGWTFDKPGQYAIEVTYETPDGKGGVLAASSGAVVVSIRPSPVGEDIIGRGKGVSREVGKFLTWMTGDHLETGRAKLREVIEKSPDSVMANYAHAAFARSWGEAFTDYRKREVRPADCGQAMAQIARTRAEILPPYVRLQLAFTAARCDARAGKSEAARANIQIAKELMRDRAEYRGLADRVAELERYLSRN